MTKSFFMIAVCDNLYTVGTPEDFSIVEDTIHFNRCKQVACIYTLSIMNDVTIETTEYFQLMLFTDSTLIQAEPNVATFFIEDISSMSMTP